VTTTATSRARGPRRNQNGQQINRRRQQVPPPHPILFLQDEIEPGRPHPNDQIRQLLVDYPGVVKLPRNHARNIRRNDPQTTPASCFQLELERVARGETPSNEEENMAKAAISGKSYLTALLIECQPFTPRKDVSGSTMLRVFADHDCHPRDLTGYSPTDPEEETKAFDHMFYGPPNALIARGIFLGTLTITIVWKEGREVTFPVNIYESVGLSRAPVLINLCHGLWGAKLRGCMILVNGVLLAGYERFCFKSRLNSGDWIKIIPIGNGLWGGSQQDAVIPPLGENASPAAPEALPTYQQAIEASRAQEIFEDSDVVQHNIQPVPDNDQQLDDDDDDDVYEGEEEEEKQPLSIEQQIEQAQQRLSERKRKLDKLDAEYEQAEKEDREEKYALQQVNLFNAYQTLLDIITGFPRYLTLQHTRVLQVQFMAFTIESYLNNPREDTPIEFQNQHLSGMFQQLQQLDGYEDIEDLLKVALAFTVSPDD